MSMTIMMTETLAFVRLIADNIGTYIIYRLPLHINKAVELEKKPNIFRFMSNILTHTLSRGEYRGKKAPELVFSDWISTKTKSKSHRPILSLPCFNNDYDGIWNSLWNFKHLNPLLTRQTTTENTAKRQQQQPGNLFIYVDDLMEHLCSLQQKKSRKTQKFMAFYFTLIFFPWIDTRWFFYPLPLLLCDIRAFLNFVHIERMCLLNLYLYLIIQLLKLEEIFPTFPDMLACNWAFKEIDAKNSAKKIISTWNFVLFRSQMSRMRFDEMRFFNIRLQSDFWKELSRKIIAKQWKITWSIVVIVMIHEHLRTVYFLHEQHTHSHRHIPCMHCYCYICYKILFCVYVFFYWEK